jgi:hypothetical protein
MAAILPYSDQADSDPNHLVVTTYPSPMDPLKPIATVEWVRHNLGRSEKDAAVTFTLLVDREEMTEVAALRFAEKFAEANHVPAIYHNRTR